DSNSKKADTMTHRLNGKDFYSRDRAELSATRINCESNAGIDYNACIESGAYQQLEMLRGCLNPRNPREFSVQNRAVEQQFYRQGVLPQIQISLENNYDVSTIPGAGVYSTAGYFDGSSCRPRGPG